MKRSLQEIVELVIFALIALVVGTGLLWVFGWLLGLVGIVFKFIAGLIWIVLRYILPVAIVAAVIFFLIRFATNRSKKPVEASAVTIDAESSDAAEKVEEASEAVVEKAEDAKEAVTETAAEIKDATVEKVEEAKDVATEKAEEIKDATVEKVEEAKETAVKVKNVKDSLDSNASESDETKKE